MSEYTEPIIDDPIKAAESEARLERISYLWSEAEALALKEVLYRASYIISTFKFDYFIMGMGTWFFEKGEVLYNFNDEECDYLTDFMDEWGNNLKVTGEGIKLLADGSIEELK